MNQGVCLICVNYKSEEATRAFLESLGACGSTLEVEIYVVDNSPKTEHLDFLKTICSDAGARYIRSERNLGYLGAASRVVADRLHAGEKMPKWTIVSNPDVLFVDPQFFKRLAERNVDENVGLLAPKILSSRYGNDQNPYMTVRPSPRKIRFYSLLYRTYIGTLLHQYVALGVKKVQREVIARSSEADSTVASSPYRIYAPHGSFMIINNAFFAAGGTLAYPEFLFGEEIYLAEQARLLGLSILYVPDLKVVHTEHISTGVVKNRLMVSYEKRAIDYLYREYFQHELQ